MEAEKNLSKKFLEKDDLVKVREGLFEISKDFKAGMKVPARVFVNEDMLDDVLKDRSLWQITNVATLPGIQRAAYAMPDIHEGYGFPIGGVAATDISQNGVISPGGIGYDINCGVRLLKVDITLGEISSKLETLATEISRSVPSGLGRSGRLKLNKKDLDDVLRLGPKKLLEMGYGCARDIDFCESRGVLKEAYPEYVSQRAKERGHDQIGTLGSGNHFLEMQRVDEIYDPVAAETFGLRKGMLVIMIHCGSRGLGHQVCTDYVKIMVNKLDSWGLKLPDLELACAPFNSPEGQDYFRAMSAAANFAWANRHFIGHYVRDCCERVLGVTAETVYDIAHNIGKVEKHVINGKEKDLVVHRKGATRAFPAGHPDIIRQYQKVGHPVFIPGTMGTSSYVLVGTKTGMDEAFGSSCHGAGRRMSRSKAKKQVRGVTLKEELKKRGIIIKARSGAGLAEEAPLAYKDVDLVVRVVEEAKIANRVAKLLPKAVIKGD